LPFDGSPGQEVNTGDLFFQEPTLSSDKKMLGFIVQTPATPPEAFVAHLTDFSPIQISTENQSFRSLPKINTEIISWKSKDGMDIQGLLTLPVNYDKSKRYPLLLVVHGGPMGFFDESFIGTPNPYPIASFAQEGFLILRPNPRGSS